MEWTTDCPLFGNGEALDRARQPVQPLSEVPSANQVLYMQVAALAKVSGDGALGAIEESLPVALACSRGNGSSHTMSVSYRKWPNTARLTNKCFIYPLALPLALPVGFPRWLSPLALPTVSSWISPLARLVSPCSPKGSPGLVSPLAFPTGFPHWISPVALPARPPALALPCCGFPCWLPHWLSPAGSE